MGTVAVKPGIGDLINGLLDDTSVKRRWQEDPVAVMAGYDLDDAERQALLQGDAEALVGTGASERLTRRLSVAW
jgi:hypothetical protein